jgi:hypothetical protein
MGRPLKDLTGQQFGLLTVVGRAPSDARGETRWNCVCSGGGPRCKGQTVVLSKNLLRGKAKGCGCLSAMSVPPPSPGDMFGRWRLVRQEETIRGGRRWLCVCSCPEATEKVVNQDTLRRGESTSCGCYNREQISARNEHSAFLSRLRSEARAHGAAVDF